MDSFTEAEGREDDGTDDYSEAGLDALGEDTEEKPMDPCATYLVQSSTSTPTTPSRVQPSWGGASMTSFPGIGEESTFERIKTQPA